MRGRSDVGDSHSNNHHHSHHDNHNNHYDNPHHHDDNRTTNTTTVGDQSIGYIAASQLAVHIMTGMITDLFLPHDTAASASHRAGASANASASASTSASASARASASRRQFFRANASDLDSFHFPHVSPIKVHCSLDGMLWVVATVLQMLLTARLQPAHNAHLQPAYSAHAQPAHNAHAQPAHSDTAPSAPLVTGLFDNATTTKLLTHLFHSHQQVNTPYQYTLSLYTINTSVILSNHN